MKRNTLPALLVLAVLAGCIGAGSGTGPQATFATGSGNTTLNLVVADEPAEWRQGLMHRDTLPRDGMLFIFPQAAERTFWMANTSIPLDMVFVSTEGFVLNVEEADPEPGVPAAELVRYTSAGPAKWVIETRQGFSREHGIAAGTRVWIRP